MSTRGVYVFLDEGENKGHVVYKHQDNYPSDAIDFIAAARRAAWPLPRFEADEFAASFVAANKDSPGGVRLCGFGDWKYLAPGDIEYVYLIRKDSVKVLEVNCGFGSAPWGQTVLGTHPLTDIENLNLGQFD